MFLDVLMVWHAFMLNPRTYLEDCMRYGLKDLWTTGMPWQVVNAAIDTRFNYEAPQEAKDSWVILTGRPWDNTEDSATKEIKCPKCTHVVRVPWTTCGLPQDNSGTWYARLPLKNVVGFLTNLL
jgi:hypothetical protein